MRERNRREFLADVGRGMLIASAGPALAAELGLSPAHAADGPDRLTFGRLEPLAGLMQDTPPDKLLPQLVARLKDGTSLRDLVAAGALANARAFGGEDYTGYHTLMALAPAFHMAGELPAERAALPVLKVLYRNSARVQEKGQRRDTLRPVPFPLPSYGQAPSDGIRAAARRKDMDAAEGIFAAAAANGSPQEALDHLLATVADGTDVHRVVLPYRAYCLVDLVGRENAHTLLRQSVRFCVAGESPRAAEYYAPARKTLARMLDQYKLPGRALGNRTVDDGWVERMSQTLFSSTAAQAAEAAAAALAEGIAPDAIGEAISLAANQLVLRDAGRPKEQARPGKPAGSVHGDSIGVHASDAANAWRHLARAAGPRHAAVCLVIGAYQVAADRVERGGDFLGWQPRPWAEHRAAVKATEPAELLHETEAAIRANDQARACALMARYCEQSHAARPAFDLLLRYAVSEEGALHAEKYYRTVAEEFAATRPVFRGRQLVALARVTASEHGHPAAGYAESCRLLGV